MPLPESEWSLAPRSNEWTVLAVIRPGPKGLWVNRPEHAQLLGLPTADAEATKLRRVQRVQVFLDRGHGVVRVIHAVRDHEVLAREMAHDRVVAVTETGPHFPFRLAPPPEVIRQLRLRTDGAEDPKLNDSVAWVVPTAEFVAWRKVTSAPPEKAAKPMRSVLKGIRKKRLLESAPATPPRFRR
jgi:hypothetical protein